MFLVAQKHVPHTDICNVIFADGLEIFLSPYIEPLNPIEYEAHLKVTHIVLLSGLAYIPFAACQHIADFLGGADVGGIGEHESDYCLKDRKAVLAPSEQIFREREGLHVYRDVAAAQKRCDFSAQNV